MSLLIFFIVLSILVLVHEFGHFIAAKRADILVEEFGVGLPPRLWGKKIGETIYSLNLLPFGGFVKLFGEEGEEGKEPQHHPSTIRCGASVGCGARHGKLTERIRKRAFFSQPILTRAIVCTAGVAMNFLLAVAVFSLVYSVMGVPKKQGYVEIVGVIKSSPAEEAGLKEKDIVVHLTISNQQLAINHNEEFVDLVSQHLGEEIELEVEREGESLIVVVTPRKEAPEGEGPLGVIISDTKMVFYPWWQRPLRGIWWGLKEALGWGLMVVEGIGVMFYQLIFKGITPEGIAGPVGIYEITKLAAKFGWLRVLQFLGILSVNLAVINILPFPALDGGRLLFLGIERLTGKKVRAKYERWVHTAGLIILITLMLLITFRDIQRIFSG